MGKRERLAQSEETIVRKNKAIGSLYGICVILAIFGYCFFNNSGNVQTKNLINEQNIRGRHLQNIVREFATTQQFCDDFKVKTGVALKVSEVEYQMDEHNFKNFDKNYAYRICQEYWR